MIKNILLALFSFALLSADDSGCKRRGGDGANGERPAATARTARPVEFLLKELRANALPDGARSLVGQASVGVEQDGATVSATANLIWLRDSVVWLNVKKFGIEGARALLTPDSIVLLNRLENSYSIKTWPELRRTYSLPAGFELLQPLLLNAAWVMPDLTYTASVRDGLHVLTGANANVTAEYGLEEGTFRLRELRFVDRRESRSVFIRFDRYKKLGGATWFSYLRTLEAFSPTDGAVRLEFEFNDVELNEPKPYRFEIPAHYRRVD